MTKLSRSFVRERELIIVDAEVVGPANTTNARLVLDTGPLRLRWFRVDRDLGYTRRDSFKKAKVHTAVGEEKGYWLRVAEFSVLGVTTPNSRDRVPTRASEHRRTGWNELPPALQLRGQAAERRILVELIKR